MKFLSGPILSIDWEDNTMLVTFKSGDKLKFIGAKEWQYENVISSKNPAKELEKLKKYVPNVYL